MLDKHVRVVVLGFLGGEFFKMNLYSHKETQMRGKLHPNYSRYQIPQLLLKHQKFQNHLFLPLCFLQMTKVFIGYILASPFVHFLCC